MDRTLRASKAENKRRNQRNSNAWQLFSPDGKTCRYCEHDGPQHLVSSGQPHFFRLATEAEQNDWSIRLYLDRLLGSGSPLLRRMTVANRAELITAYCAECAEIIGTEQALCYQRNLAIGETVGLE